MNDYKKIITAQDSAVSFLPKNITSRFGCAELICKKLCENYNSALIVCTDHAYFALGKRVKDCLIESKIKVSCFCLDSEVVSRNVLKKMLQSEGESDCILVVGEDVLSCQVLLLAGDKKLIFLPLNFEFSLFLQSKKSDGAFLVFDDKVFSSLPKNKLLSGVKSVLSKNVFFIESAVYEAIEGVLVKNESLSLLDQANLLLNDYYKTRDIKNLIMAQLFSSFAVTNSEIENTPLLLASQIVDVEGLADFGEREYMFYQMIIKIYALYLNSDTSFLVKLPTAIECFEDGEKHDALKNIPDFLFDDIKISAHKQKILHSGKIKHTVNNYLQMLDQNEKIFHAIYAGRKYTYQNYNQKQRAKALKQAPLASTKKSLLKLIWADGLLEYV